jgi:hypothetical protein
MQYHDSDIVADVFGKRAGLDAHDEVIEGVEGLVVERVPREYPKQV